MDGRYSCIKKLKERFELQAGENGYPTLIDVQNVFKFNGMILLDRPGIDRIQNMIDFLETFA